MERRRGAFQVWGGVSTLVLLTMCQKEGPEAQVARAYAEVVAALEERDPGAVVDHLDDRFQGPDGLPKAQVRLLLLGIFRQGPIKVRRLRDSITVKGDDAEQEVLLLLTQGGDSLLPQDASKRGYRLTWRRRGAHWKVAAVEALP